MIPVPLPHHFRRDGFDFVLFVRRGSVAICQQTKDSLPGFRSYAVGIICVKPERVVFGIKVAAKEKFPTDGEWGHRAWSCATLERATERMRQLLAAQPSRTAEDRNGQSFCAKEGHP